VSRVSNIIRTLAARVVPLTDTLLLEAYAWTIEQDIPVKDLLHEDVGATLVASIGAQ
jgi:hypothetical protein